MFKLAKNTKGFTLVEVIVVLVILAILATIMIPSMTKWIDRAKDRSVLVECRSVLLAAQTLSSEQYAVGDPAFSTTDTDPITSQKILDLAGVTKTGAAVTAITYNTTNTGAIETLNYTATDSTKWLYTASTSTWAKQ